MDGRYSGDEKVPDYSVSVGNGPVAIIIEVGVSQLLEDLEKCAEKWLIGKRVHLVILVDVNIDTLEAQPPPRSFSSVRELEGSSEPNLPYDLNIADLSEGSSATMALKLL